MSVIRAAAALVFLSAGSAFAAGNCLENCDQIPKACNKGCNQTAKENVSMCKSKCDDLAKTCRKQCDSKKN